MSKEYTFTPELSRRMKAWRRRRMLNAVCEVSKPAAILIGTACVLILWVLVLIRILQIDRS